MSRKKNKTTETNPDATLVRATEDVAWQPNERIGWTPLQRGVASIVLLLFLFILLLGPLNNPVGSDHFSRPLGRWISPVHQVLFLGHGYRFFGPDPGPGHWIECRLIAADETVTEIRFPDRQEHWPRLRYHRWFMLAETLFSELNGTPDQSSFAQTQVELQEQIDQLRSDGKLEESLRLAAQRDELLLEYEQARERIDRLVEAIARHFLRQHVDAVSIELVLRERSIPFPDDISDGIRLDDERYISEPIVIGKFSRSDLLSSSQLPRPF